MSTRFWLASVFFLLFPVFSYANEVSGSLTADGQACEAVFRYGHGGIYLTGGLGGGTVNVQWRRDNGTWTTARSMTSISEAYEYYQFGRENTRVRIDISGSTSPTLTCIMRPNTDK